nr:MAG TPA: hypothetical protein [Caudoviricetes sp.]
MQVRMNARRALKRSARHLPKPLNVRSTKE